MAAAAFYQIYISPRPGVTREKVETVLNNAIDWFRYDPKCWVVYTTSDAKTWHARLQPHVEPGGELFICKLDVSDYWGFIDKRLWDWIKKAR